MSNSGKFPKVIFLKRRPDDGEMFESLKRMLKDKAEVVDGTGNDFGDCRCVIADLNDDGLKEDSCQQKLVSDILLAESVKMLPHILLLGEEQTGLVEYNRERQNGKRWSGLQLLTELCPEYYTYIPKPCDIVVLAEAISAALAGEERANPFVDFGETVKKCAQFAQEQIKCLKRIQVAKASAKETRAKEGKKGGRAKQQSRDVWAADYLREMKHAAAKLKAFISDERGGDVVRAFESAGEYTLRSVIESRKRDESHGRIDLAQQLYSLLIGLVRHRKRLALTKAEAAKPFNVCLIEDRLGGRLYFETITLGRLFTEYLNFEGVRYRSWGEKENNGREGSLLRPLKELLEAELIASADPRVPTPEFISPRPLTGQADDKLGAFADIDCILVDILLRDGALYYDGVEFVRLLTNTHPEIPVIVLSKSDDACDIKHAMENGASYYILKSRALTLPDHYYDYMDELGKLIWLIKDDKLRRNLLGNIRYWHFKRDLLWFGNKCYHIVDHAFNHMSNVWNLANQIVYPVLTRPGAKYDDKDLYAFCMAVWLHDIGHKGNARYGLSHQVRDLHPLISAELLLENPGDYRLELTEDEELRTRTYSYPRFSTERSGVARLRENAAHPPGILEKVALICAYHKDNCPIFDKEVKDIERIPLDFYEAGSRDRQVITLQAIVGDNSPILKYTALLRFIDGLDINKNRVGDVNERTERERVAQRDLDYNLHLLRAEVERLVATTPVESGRARAFRELFYDKVRDGIRKKQNVADDVLKEQEQFCRSLPCYPELEAYHQLVDYCRYLSVQVGHFDLHASVDRLEIRYKPGASRSVEVHYFCSRDRADLLDAGKYSVKERWEQEGKSIAGHLLGFRSAQGNQQGYVMEKLKKSAAVLSKEWFSIDEQDIVLHSSDGKELRKFDVTGKP